MFLYARRRMDRQHLLAWVLGLVTGLAMLFLERGL